MAVATGLANWSASAAAKLISAIPIVLRLPIRRTDLVIHPVEEAFEFARPSDFVSRIVLLLIQFVRIHLLVLL